jgi:CTP-dependent riboflavin kinase
MWNLRPIIHCLKISYGLKRLSTAVSVSIVPCRIFNRRVFLLHTDPNENGTGHHPRNIIEIATDIRLRDRYQLKEGDWVEVEFP